MSTGWGRESTQKDVWVAMKENLLHDSGYVPS